VNDAFCQIYELPMEELVGKPLTSLESTIHEDDRSRVYDYGWKRLDR